MARIAPAAINGPVGLAIMSFLATLWTVYDRAQTMTPGLAAVQENWTVRSPYSAMRRPSRSGTSR